MFIHFVTTYLYESKFFDLATTKTKFKKPSRRCEQFSYCCVQDGAGNKSPCHTRSTASISSILYSKVFTLIYSFTLSKRL